MEISGFPLLSAVWLGILTSISPCPLASNIAAVSFIVKKIEHPLSVFNSGVFYTLGRIIGYTALGVLITSSLLSIPQTAFFLQHYMNRILGPVLIITGFMLLGVVHIPFFNSSVSVKTAERVKDFGAFGSLLLGIIFALSFCPISAALFFGSLIPLALKNSSQIVMPSLYGMGTGLPVLGFAVVLAFGVTNLEKIFKQVRVLEYWMKRVTGIIFILVGIYYVSAHIFSFNPFS
jgi:cytochrome c biogenesis protein CcdA